jgi:predicted nucleic acid-binding protein
MILVDTSVYIDLLKGANNSKVELFTKVLDLGMPYGISPYTYQEVLQGARDELEFRRVRKQLDSEMLLELPTGVMPYREAARLFFDLRRKGVTVRSSIDLLIACTAIEHHAYLLHNDSDFDNMAALTPDLAILTATSLPGSQ